MDSLRIFNCRLDYLEPSQVHAAIQTAVDEKNKIRVSNLNIQESNLGYENKWYESYVNDSALVLCDSKGIQLAALLLGKRPPRQITFHTWGWQLFEFCQKNKISIYFLSLDTPTLRGAIRKVKSRFPGLKLGGHHGYFRKTGRENTKVIRAINRFRPNLLMVGFGAPLQEEWIQTNQKSIHANVFLNLGAFLVWIGGQKQPAPRWMTQAGLEWLYRLALEPRHLFWRYMVGNPLFFIRLIGHHYLGLKRK
jgi:N-acetylglucosaminyldiphosphoundecaprenol N-acetyl-beta-D-mannosaminyltransferase